MSDDTKEQSIEPQDEPISQPFGTLFGELIAPPAEPLVGVTQDVGKQPKMQIVVQLSI